MDANELATQICGCATPQQRKADIAALLAFREAAVSEALTTAQAQAAAQEQRIAAFREALTPSGDTKAAYHGEFSFSEERYDPGADEYYQEKVYVPWTTIKEIMAAIAARAALGEQQ